MEIQVILFGVFSFIMLFSALGVIWHQNPVKSALFLVVFFVGLAATYALLGADFLAAVQILVYVGAIMVLFLFVIMLIAIRDDIFQNYGSSWLKNILVSLLTGSFLLQFIVILGISRSGDEKMIDRGVEYVHKLSDTTTLRGNVEVLSYNLFSTYLLPFELMSILLLVAVIGAVILAKRDRRGLE